MKHWTATICLAVLLLAGMTADVSPAKDEPSDSKTAGVESSRDDFTYAQTEWPDAPDTAALLRRLVVGTVIVLGLCVCTLWMARRWLRGAPARTTAGRTLHLVESVSLGNRCTVHLVRAGDHQVLVGVDSAGIKSVVPLPQSFEHAIADTETPALETAVYVEGRELRIA